MSTSRSHYIDGTSYRSTNLLSGVYDNVKSDVTNISTLGSGKISYKDMGIIRDVETHMYPLNGKFDCDADWKMDYGELHAEDFQFNNRPEFAVSASNYHVVTWTIYRFAMYTSSNTTTRSDLVICRGVCYNDLTSYPYDYYKRVYPSTKSVNGFIDTPYLVYLPVAMDNSIGSTGFSTKSVPSKDGKSSIDINVSINPGSIYTKYDKSDNIVSMLYKNQDMGYYVECHTRTYETMSDGGVHNMNSIPVLDVSINFPSIYITNTSTQEQSEAYRGFQWLNPTSKHFIINTDSTDAGCNGNVLDFLVIGEAKLDDPRSNS